jgi:hypothetical protein
MPAYRALIEGRNFVLDVEGRKGRYGFYQTVFVRGADPSEAEINAVGIVKGDSELKLATQNESNDPPMLYLDSLEELEASDLPPNENGRTYYVEKRWWQFWR